MAKLSKLDSKLSKMGLDLSRNCFFNDVCHNLPTSTFKHAAHPQADPSSPGRLRPGFLGTSDQPCTGIRSGLHGFFWYSGRHDWQPRVAFWTSVQFKINEAIYLPFDDQVFNSNPALSVDHQRIHICLWPLTLFRLFCSVFPAQLSCNGTCNGFCPRDSRRSCHNMAISPFLDWA